MLLYVCLCFEMMERITDVYDHYQASEERSIEELLDNARGFIDTTQQERYDECESAVNDVLQRIRRVAPQWKVSVAGICTISDVLTLGI